MDKVKALEAINSLAEAALKEDHPTFAIMVTGDRSEISTECGDVLQTQVNIESVSITISE